MQLSPAPRILLTLKTKIMKEEKEELEDGVKMEGVARGILEEFETPKEVQKEMMTHLEKLIELSQKHQVPFIGLVHFATKNVDAESERGTYTGHISAHGSIEQLAFMVIKNMESKDVFKKVIMKAAAHVAEREVRDMINNLGMEG